MTQPGTVGVTGPVAPKNAAERYPAHDSFWGKGGYREVADITARDNIPSERQRVGMLVWVADRGDGNPETYILDTVGDPGTYSVAFAFLGGEWTDGGTFIYPTDGDTKQVVVGKTSAPSGAGAIMEVANGHLQVGSAWNGAHFMMGSYHLWVDAAGRPRIKSSAPTSDTDGVIIGTQS